MIHLLFLKQKYEIFAVYCAQIKDLNNLCVRPTIACLQAIVSPVKDLNNNYQLLTNPPLYKNSQKTIDILYYTLYNIIKIKY